MICLAMAEEKEHDEQSVLRSKLSTMTNQIVFGGLMVALCTFLILVIRFSITHYCIEGSEFKPGHLDYYVYYLIVAITVLIVAIPEGLPMAVTLALAYSAKRVIINAIWAFN